MYNECTIRERRKIEKMGWVPGGVDYIGVFWPKHNELFEFVTKILMYHNFLHIIIKFLTSTFIVS